MNEALGKKFAEIKERSNGGFLVDKRRRFRANELDAANAWRRVESSVWAERILAQIEYCLKVSKLAGGAYDTLLDRALAYLHRRLEADGALTKTAVFEGEAMLAEMASAAKALTIMCVGQAHIDMNWKWSWTETVSTTLETLRTVLALMDEFPAFTFAQSQAAIYRIVEEHEPEMLEAIRHRVHEGRWEVVASQWVEGDKNLPNGESLARHVLYSKRYLSRLLEIDPHDLRVAFEPDTFGHNGNMPEILADGGVSWMYHCRGWGGPYLHRWTAPSGRSILVCREGRWYNTQIEPSMLLLAAQFKEATGSDTALALYGVGDHGGGPTRRDLETLRDVATWPLAPRMEPATCRRFFETVESSGLDLPAIDHELNFKFTGCFSSQSRIKMANRKSEAALFEAELFRAWANQAGLAPYRPDVFEEAWRRTLFNQFHDLLPGTGIEASYQHALGEFQKTMAAALTQKSQALQALAGAVDTRPWDEAQDEVCSMAEGAGAGAGVDRLVIAPVSRGRGGARVFVVFNPLPFARDEAVEIALWDWSAGAGRLRFVDSEGAALEHQSLGGLESDHGHTRLRVLVRMRVPAAGYAVCVARDAGFDPPAKAFRMTSGTIIGSTEQVDLPRRHALENSRLRVEFDPQDASIVSLVDKRSGRELMDAKRGGARFRLIHEDPSGDAWHMRRYMQIDDLKNDVKIRAIHANPDAVRQSVEMEVPFGASLLRAAITLDKDSPSLVFDCAVDWREVGTPATCVPQLNYAAPLAFAPREYVCDRPFGTAGRPPLAHDVGANSWMLAVASDGPSVALASDARSGFRGDGDTLSMPLMRATYKPDPYPEIGSHRLRFRLGVVDDVTPDAVIRSVQEFVHPLTAVSTGIHAGALGPRGSFLEILKGSVALSGVKKSESGEGLLIRLYETRGVRTEVELRVGFPIQSARRVDLNEQKIAGAVATDADGRISLVIEPFRVATLELAPSANRRRGAAC